MKWIENSTHMHVHLQEPQWYCAWLLKLSQLKWLGKWIGPLGESHCQWTGIGVVRFNWSTIPPGSVCLLQYNINVFFVSRLTLTTEIHPVVTSYVVFLHKSCTSCPNLGGGGRLFVQCLREHIFLGRSSLRWAMKDKLGHKYENTKRQKDRETERQNDRT